MLYRDLRLRELAPAPRKEGGITEPILHIFGHPRTCTWYILHISCTTYLHTRTNILGSKSHLQCGTTTTPYTKINTLTTESEVRIGGDLVSVSSSTGTISDLKWPL